MKVYVVTYQKVAYACSCCCAEAYDYKDITTSGFNIEGLFRTKKAAEQFIDTKMKKELDEMADDADSEKRIREEFDLHYCIEAKDLT